VILSVDTTHEFGSLALTDGETLVEEVLLHSPDGFGHVLFEHLGALLERHACKVDEIECFAAASGPGSFTGVRIGLACVKGLAEAVGKPVAGVSNLEAIATFGSGALRAAVMDARRGEVYGAVYDAAGRNVCDEVVTKLAAWLDSLPGDVDFVSQDFTDLGKSPVTAAPKALARAIGRIAHRRLRAGLALDPAALDANYVRRSDAELLWKDLK
jgi:tRNA threonylcarbamoyladenosine biosynthesis protein TsaB